MGHTGCSEAFCEAMRPQMTKLRESTRSIQSHKDRQQVRQSRVQSTITLERGQLRRDLEKVEHSSETLSARSQSLSEQLLSNRTSKDLAGNKVKVFELNKRKAMKARMQTEKKIAHLSDPNSAGRLALRLYKDVCKEVNNKPAPVLMFPIKNKLSVPVDLDSLSHDMELAL